MGLFDDIFGGSTSSKKQTTGTTKTAAEALQEQQEASTITTTGTGTTAQQTAQQQTRQQQQRTRLLSPEIETALSQLVLQLTGAAGPGVSAVPEVFQEGSAQAVDFARALAERAGQTEEVIGGQIGAILDEARRSGANALEARGTQLAQSAGSNLNSIVQAAQAQGQSDLETQLAGLKGQLTLQGRELASRDLIAALGGLTEGVRTGADISLAGQQTGVQNIAQLANILRGATQETSLTGLLSSLGTAETQTQQQQQQLADILRRVGSQQIQEQVTTGRAVGQAQSSPSIFDAASGVLGLFG